MSVPSSTAGKLPQSSNTSHENCGVDLLKTLMKSKNIGASSSESSHALIDTQSEIISKVLEEECNEDDLAQSKYMIKSIFGLLTTASIYATLDNEAETTMGEVSLDFTEYTKEDQLLGNLNPLLQNVPPIRGSSSEELYSANQIRKPTLFNVSVIPNIELDSRENKCNEDVTDHKIKLKKILTEKFQLEREEHIIEYFSAWYLKEVLIQGHIFITDSYLLFLAELPKVSGTVKLSGSLSLRSLLKGNLRYWCILKDDMLSIYNSPTDLYFPVYSFKIRDIEDIEISRKSKMETGSKSFNITTEEKLYKFVADSVHSAKTWVNAIRRQQFALQNTDTNAIKLKVVISDIIDVEDQQIIQQALTIKIRTLEDKVTFTVDDYVFLFFNGNSLKLKDLLIKQMADVESKVDLSKTMPAIISNLNMSLQLQDSLNLKTGSSEIIINNESNINGEKSKWRVISKLGKLKNTFSSDLNPDKTTIEYYSNSNKIPNKVYECNSSCNQYSITEFDNNGCKTSKIADWTSAPFKNISSMWNSYPVHYKSNNGLFSDDDPYLSKDEEVSNDRFKEHFQTREGPNLVATYYAYLNRNIPLYGKLYLTNYVLCFRSLLPGVNLKMVLPLANIETCYTDSSFNFGYYGLVIVAYGQEELFFDFSTEISRADFEYVLLKSIDNNSSKNIFEDSSIAHVIDSETNNAKIKFFEDKINAEGFDIPLLIDENPYFKTKITPNKSYKIGLLTIGSRGDVQPYIALGKGLLKEGHRVTIITHGEFKEFIESHGIDFKEIAGDPTELMVLMVEHESMNVGMLREASAKFRGWIDELLNSTWTACKLLNLDILIESPSAMAGIHISEALKIPYFRAFTMPWTKTRAYPHAFIVPDQKRGGSYNYLTHVLFENIFWRGTSWQINNWRVKELGLEKTSLSQLQQNKVPFLYNMSPTIFPPAIDFSEWIKVTGYWFLDENTKYTPSDKLKQFLSKAKKLNKKVVYIGFGSIVVNNARELTQAILNAVDDSDVFCILNKGWSERLEPANLDLPELFELSPNVYDSGSIPHDWLFPRIDAAVHHGGSGTTGATLRAGIPSVIKPFFGDQFFYASRIEDIGAGIALKKLNVSSLSNALKRVTTDKRIINKAQAMKKMIAKENGVASAINCIYSELEYARSLIVNRRVKPQNECESSIPLDNKITIIKSPNAIDEPWKML